MPEQESLKRELSKMERGRGQRYPAAVKARVVAWSKSERERGGSWEKIATEVGVHAKTLREWCMEGGARRMRRVRVVDEHRSVSLVSPSGYRIEGVSLTEAAALIAKLG